MLQVPHKIKLLKEKKQTKKVIQTFLNTTRYPVAWVADILPGFLRPCAEGGSK